MYNLSFFTIKKCFKGAPIIKSGGGECDYRPTVRVEMVHEFDLAELRIIFVVQAAILPRELSRFKE